ncbi:MAG: hypothetical protein HGB04_06560 [Chlorobiaceae bacterium]|nr:hypothetical protein [Chlorobiaceae bacterium]
MNDTQQTLDLLKTSQASPDDLIKSFVQPSSATTGLQAYNLEAPSKKLYLVMTPFRNSIARVSGGYAIQANWKAITSINAGKQRAGVSEGKRGGIITHASAEYLAAFRGFGLENTVTFEANYAAKNFEDVKALAVLQTLQATMIQEERLIMGGNTSVALGTTPNPTLAVSAGGSLADATEYRVICIALGIQAYLDVVGVNNGSMGEYFDAATADVPGQITRTNADGTTDTFGGGSARKSSAVTVTTTAANQKISATVAAVNGAVGYAWYLGTTAGTERLAAVTSINSVVLTAAAGAAAQLASALADSDNSTSSLDFDGLLYQAAKSGSGAYIKSLATGTAGTGSTLTSDGAAGITELNEAFEYLWTRYRLSPTKIYVSAQEQKNISAKVIANAGAPMLRQMIGPDFNGRLDAGVLVGRVLNKATGVYVPLEVHPNLPAGTMMLFSDSLPYPLADVGSVVRMLMRQDYYQLEWPLRTRKYEYGVYADGVLQHYAPFSMGVITNIANG